MLTEEQQIIEQISKANNILIAFTKDWNGDAVSSALALYLFLKKMDKKVDIVAQKAVTNNSNHIDQADMNLFSFLPSFGEIKNEIENLRKFIISLNIANAKISQIKYKMEKDSLNFIISPKEGFFTPDDISSNSGGFKYDLIITLDTTDLESLGCIYDNDTEFFYKTTIINIDHHAENESYGQINLVDLNAVATSEILFKLFKQQAKNLIDEDIATCLLSGIISKTKSFKTQNITPQTLITTSELVGLGGRREEIVNRLYRSRNLNVLKLWGNVLSKLSGDMDNKLIWSTLAQADFLNTGSSPDDLSDVVDELIINIPQAKVIVLIYEKIPKIAGEETKQIIPETSVLVYATKNISSLDLIKEYNPTGTKMLAKTTINQPMQLVEKEIITNIKNKLTLFGI